MRLHILFLKHLKLFLCSLLFLHLSRALLAPARGRVPLDHAEFPPEIDIDLDKYFICQFPSLLERPAAGGGAVAPGRPGGDDAVDGRPELPPQPHLRRLLLRLKTRLRHRFELHKTPVRITCQSFDRDEDD